MTASTKVIIFILVSTVGADVYLHNPRGSNNRLDEKTRGRTNGNSIFDSQNNERGGYNVGSLFYYQGSTLSIEWTNQHSCGTGNNHCDLILQYMCHPSIRDGVTTQTIPVNRAQCAGYNCDTDRRFRMHEDYSHYLGCTLWERNKGLFTADQNLNKKNSARSTRQNPKGTRRGYECPEERDYYPYWLPSPWVDIAVMTSDASRCHHYQQESQNVKSRWACVFPPSIMDKIKNKVILPITKAACENYELPASIKVDVRKPTWKEFPSHGIAAPHCRETEYTRDNHLGNGLGGHPNMYNWTIPQNVVSENCVLRIRYNISTSDYDNWNINSSMNANPKKLGEGSRLPLAEKFGFDSETTARDRGYVFKNNPVVKVFDGLDVDLRLAINTAQFGRVFQDRSHTFGIRPAPEGLEGKTIHNLNVRGKRGNIVQVYPGVEYDFVPNDLEVVSGDYIHIQWTGSNTNPGNNDGQGLAGTDRNNIVLLASQAYPEGRGSRVYKDGKYGHYGRNFPMQAENSTFLGLSRDDAVTLAFVDPGQYGGEMSELDDAGTYFNLPLRKMTQPGTYHYMCTRNNNFSNRDQKGRVTVSTSPYKTAAIGSMGGDVALPGGDAKVIVSEGTFDSLKKLRLEQWSIQDGEKMMKASNKKLSEGEDYASNFIVLTPDNLSTENDKIVVVEMKLSEDSDVDVYHASSDFSVWSRVDADISGSRAVVKARQGGVFVARTRADDVGLIVGVVVACVVVIAIVIGAIIYFRRHPNNWQAVRTSCRNAERSMKNKV